MEEKDVAERRAEIRMGALPFQSEIRNPKSAIEGGTP